MDYLLPRLTIFYRVLVGDWVIHRYDDFLDCGTDVSQLLVTSVVIILNPWLRTHRTSITISPHDIFPRVLEPIGCKPFKIHFMTARPREATLAISNLRFDQMPITFTRGIPHVVAKLLAKNQHYDIKHLTRQWRKSEVMYAQGQVGNLLTLRQLNLN